MCVYVCLCMCVCVSVYIGRVCTCVRIHSMYTMVGLNRKECLLNVLRDNGQSVTLQYDHLVIAQGLRDTVRVCMYVCVCVCVSRCSTTIW